MIDKIVDFLLRFFSFNTPTQQVKTMTEEKITFEPKQYLDNGFVHLVDYMGSDFDIEREARKSYGKGTRSVSDTKHLLRFMWRHQHSSPFEMGELKFHIRIPIFVARQLVRHRTASISELSARYSLLSDDFYVIDKSDMRQQSATNKQCSGDLLDDVVRERYSHRLPDYYENCYAMYENMLKDGFSREQARGVLPVSGYTEMYWKIDLKNFLHFVNLRMGSGAQKEIVELATLMFDQVKEIFPITTEAFLDYTVNSMKFSAKEIEILKSVSEAMDQKFVESYLDAIPTTELSKREKREFLEKLNRIYG